MARSAGQALRVDLQGGLLGGVGAACITQPGVDVALGVAKAHLGPAEHGALVGHHASRELLGHVGHPSERGQGLAGPGRRFCCPPVVTTTTPSDSLSVAPPFPGSAGYGRASLPVPLWRVGGPQLGPTTGPPMVHRSPSWARRRRMSDQPALAGRHRPPRAEEGLSSSQDSLLTVQHPLRRRVLGHPLQDPGCFPWPSPQPDGLGSLLVRLSAGLRDDAYSGFAAAADRPVARPLPGALSLRFDAGVSPDAGSRATGDPGVSPGQTRTGWLS
jgi:hypothetical protein